MKKIIANTGGCGLKLVLNLFAGHEWRGIN